MDSHRLRGWLSEHPFLAIGAVLLFLVLAGLGTVLSSTGLMGSMQAQQESLSYTGDRGAGGGDGADRAGNGVSFIEVIEASFDIEADNAEATAESIRGAANDVNGYVEGSRKHDGSLHRRVSLTVRVPDDAFITFTDRIRNQYNVEGYDITNKRIRVQHTLDAISILNQTLADYQQIRSDINAMPTGEEKIDLLMAVTDRELELEQKLQSRQRDLSEAERRGRYATVDITIQEQKAVDIWPENIKNRFMNSLKEAIDETVTIAVETVTSVFVLFLRAVQAVVFLAAIVIPFILAYRLGRPIYRRLIDAKNSNDA